MPVEPESITFTITENNLHEGGRTRDEHEVYLNCNQERAEYLGGGEEAFWCRTDTGMRFEAKISGTNLKNFRARPATALGSWLLDHHGAQADDQVVAWWEDGELRMQFVRVTPRAQEPAA